jgi:hypothetical protein
MWTARCTAVVLFVLAVVPVWASAKESEAVQGQAILRSLQQGSKSCSELSDSDFELAGEAWMEQIFGSAQAHESMNRLMASMMGSSGEEQMHEYMGRRASGCGGGSVPSSFGRMMGMMGMMGGVSTGAGGMMGGGSDSTSGNYAPGMMGGSSPTSGSAANNDDDGPSAAAMVGMMAVLIGAVAIALAIFRPWRHQADNARGLLDRRLATGEISTEEYRRAKSLLERGVG